LLVVGTALGYTLTNTADRERHERQKHQREMLQHAFAAEAVAAESMLAGCRALARSCCDVFPSRFRGESALTLAVSARMAHEHHALRPYQAGTSPRCTALNASSDGYQRHWSSFGHCDQPAAETASYVPFMHAMHGAAVYVPQNDFCNFHRSVFERLPLTTSVVLVVGQEDYGAPRFLTKMCNISHQSFLADPRLARIFLQNYDLDWRWPFVSNASFPKNWWQEALLRGTAWGSPSRSHEHMAQKIELLPIGLDFHTEAEKRDWGHREEATQMHALLSARSTKPWAFREENPCVSISFGPGYPWRKEVLDIVARIQNQTSRRGLTTGSRRITKSRRELCVVAAAGARSESMHATAQHSFALAPPGRGLDTIRFWEVLTLQTVPVVLTSSLDHLYRTFPCIILNSWEALLQPKIAHEWKKQIVLKWGKHPFSFQVRQRLTSSYWAGRVQQAAARLRKRGPSNRTQKSAVLRSAE